MIFYLNQCELPHNLALTAVLQVVSEYSATEEHMLPHSVDELEAQFAAGLSIVGVADSTPVAHATLWPLSETHNFYELGGVWVAQEMRGRQLGTVMYQLLLANHRDKNILATTTNPAAMITGERVGLVPITRQALPQTVQQASCICPREKTGTTNNRYCRLAWQEDQCATNRNPCVFRVTKRTLTHLSTDPVDLP